MKLYYPKQHVLRRTGAVPAVTLPMFLGILFIAVALLGFILACVVA